MPVVAVTVCPHPPILVPQVAAGAAPETGDLRAAAIAAVKSLADAEAVLMIGSGPTTGLEFGPGQTDLAAYGAREVDLGIEPDAPLSLLIGAWLLREAGIPVWSGLTVAADAAPADCVELGQRLAADPRRLGLLVMGDGSARQSEHAPAHLHPRAVAFDDAVASALATADTAVLDALDPFIAAEVQAAGRAPWQVLAGAAEGCEWDARLDYAAAPYGVAYFVARWSLSRASIASA
ncbi:class III extradiol dioxygenase subunit B-like domain-containing protein [Kribbella deserti]|uniref:Class III extradiol dioxygenase subunit B-like domain-containing protein n=1 Tax=Kribbella deserti TaxID=1926257 RepID=A0ABV6QWV0_9ACTN